MASRRDRSDGGEHCKVTAGAKVIEGDCLDVLPRLDDDSADLVCTDPPFGILKSQAWDDAPPSIAVWQQVKRVLKPGGRLVVIADDNLWARMQITIQDVGFEIEKPCAWLFATGMGVGQVPRAAFVPIIVARKPGKLLVRAIEDDARIPWRDERDRKDASKAKSLSHAKRNLYRAVEGNAKTYSAHPRGRHPTNVIAHDGLGDRLSHIFTVPPVTGRKGAHPTAKPVELVAQLIRLFSPPSGLVVDPYGGGGCCGVAAIATGRRAILIDRDPKFVAMARANIEAAGASDFSLAEGTYGDNFAPEVIGFDESNSPPIQAKSAKNATKSASVEEIAMMQNDLRHSDERAIVTTSPERWLTAKELAATLGICTKTVRRKGAPGGWPCVREDGLVRFLLSEVLAHIKRRKSNAHDFNQNQEPSHSSIGHLAKRRTRSSHATPDRHRGRGKVPSQTDENRTGPALGRFRSTTSPHQQGDRSGKDVGDQDQRNEFERLKAAADAARLFGGSLGKSHASGPRRGYAPND